MYIFAGFIWQATLKLVMAVSFQDIMYWNIIQQESYFPSRHGWWLFIRLKFILSSHLITTSILNELEARTRHRSCIKTGCLEAFVAWAPGEANTPLRVTVFMVDTCLLQKQSQIKNQKGQILGLPAWFVCLYICVCVREFSFSSVFSL